MTSIMNLPACYHFKYNEITHLFDVYYETTLLGKSLSEDEIKWMAKQHYARNNWTAEDQAEQDYFDRYVD